MVGLVHVRVFWMRLMRVIGLAWPRGLQAVPSRYHIWSGRARYELYGVGVVLTCEQSARHALLIRMPSLARAHARAACLAPWMTILRTTRHALALPLALGKP